MSRIDRERGYDRVQNSVEKLFEKALLFAAHFFGPNQMNFFAGKLRQNRVEKTLMLLVGELVDSF